MLARLPYVTPSAPIDLRIKAQALGDGIERVVLRFEFMETPDAPAALALLPNRQRRWTRPSS